MSPSGKGYALVVTSAFLTGLIFTVGKVAMERISPELLIAWIFSIAAVLLGAWTGATGSWRELGKCSGRDWLYLLAFSAASIIALLTMWTGLKHLDPTVASFIARLQTLVAVFLGVIFLRERFRFREATGALVLIGGVLVIRYSTAVELSYWFWVMVSSAVFFGLVEVFAKQAVRSINPVLLNFVRNSIIAAFFLIWIFLTPSESLFNLGHVWPHVILIALAGPMGSRQIFLFALRYVDVSKAVLVNQMQPLFVFVLALGLLGTIPTTQEIGGGLLILAGCVVLIGGRR